MTGGVRRSGVFGPAASVSVSCGFRPLRTADLADRNASTSASGSGCDPPRYECDGVRSVKTCEIVYSLPAALEKSTEIYDLIDTNSPYKSFMNVKYYLN